MKDYNEKVQLFKRNQDDPVKSYVKNFSEIKHVLQSLSKGTDNILSFGGALQQKIQANAKLIEDKRKQEQEYMREDAEELYLEMGMKGIELKEAVDLHVKK